MLAALGVLLMVVAVVSAVVNPELRRWFGLDRASPTVQKAEKPQAPPVLPPPTQQQPGQQQTPSADPHPPDTGCGLGHSWTEWESGYMATWSRREGTNVFDAHWTKGGEVVDAVLSINIDGNHVSIDRNEKNGSCKYSGTVKDDLSVSGTFGCSWGGPVEWKAIIGCTEPATVSPPVAHVEAAVRPAKTEPRKVSVSTPPATRPKAQGRTEITGVGPIGPKAWQRIVIDGTHFGTNPPINGCPDFIRISDVNANRSFPSLGPWGGCNNPILITSWTDTEIVIEGLPAYQRGQDAFTVGDKLKIEVRNPQESWAKMVWYSVTTSAEVAKPNSAGSPGSAASKTQEGTQILSVGPISAKAWQKIVITGAHFGTNAPINGCPDFIRITDVSTNQAFPSTGPWGGCNNPILITSWTDTRIVIEGLPAYQRGQNAFNIGDTLKLEVRSPQENWAQMAWVSIKVSRSRN